MTDATPTDSTAGAQPAPPQVDTPTPHTIRTDRPCARCGFNLFGQPIVREPHYNLTAARCPECGQLAALQEYPALGKWADRWAKLLAALYVLFLVGALFAHFGPTLGLTIGVLENSNNELAYVIARDYQAHLHSLAQGPMPNNGIGSWTPIDQDWWATNRARILESVGGRYAMIDNATYAMWFPLTLITFAFAVFWSTALLNTRRPFAFAFALVPPAIAVTIVTIVTANSIQNSNLNASNAATSAMLPLLIPLTSAIILITLVLGVFFGRKFTRLIVRLALPPRMRSALSVLWTRDNLTPPTANKHRVPKP